MAESRDKSTQFANDDFTHWQLPDVSIDPYESGSDAFGHQGTASGEVQDPDNLMPPTMAELEQIRIAAEQEGYEEGYALGYKEGLEQGKQEGLKQGHQQGVEQGHKQGYEESTTRGKKVIERLEDIMAQLQHPLMILDKDIEQELMELVITLSTSVVGYEMKTHPEHILTALRQGIEVLPVKSRQVSINLHPDDAALVRDTYTQVQLEKNGWEIIENSELSVGDCFLESQQSCVDLRLQERLDSVLASSVQRQTQLAQEAQKVVANKPENLQTQVTLDEAASTKLSDDVIVQEQKNAEADVQNNEEQGTQNADQTKPTTE